jgi:hypothetical protein
MGQIHIRHLNTVDGDLPGVGLDPDTLPSKLVKGLTCPLDS